MKSGFDVIEAKKNLWMSENELRTIYGQGHTSGMHSYSHPMQMSKLPKSKQEIEFRRNYEHLSRITGSPISVMAHPCGDYNSDTLNILDSMGVVMGFRKDMSITKIKSSLEIPRKNHTNVFKQMKR